MMRCPPLLPFVQSQLRSLAGGLEAHGGGIGEAHRGSGWEGWREEGGGLSPEGAQARRGERAGFAFCGYTALKGVSTIALPSLFFVHGFRHQASMKERCYRPARPPRHLLLHGKNAVGRKELQFSHVCEGCVKKQSIRG